MDFFVVPTVTGRMLYVLMVIMHERRKVIHFNITQTPTATWTAQQVINAFPYGTAPQYLLRDQDSIYGSVFVQRVEGLGLKQKLISPRSSSGGEADAKRRSDRQSRAPEWPANPITAKRPDFALPQVIWAGNQCWHGQPWIGASERIRIHPLRIPRCPLVYQRYRK